MFVRLLVLLRSAHALRDCFFVGETFPEVFLCLLILSFMVFLLQLLLEVGLCSLGPLQILNFYCIFFGLELGIIFVDFSLVAKAVLHMLDLFEERVAVVKVFIGKDHKLSDWLTLQNLIEVLGLGQVLILIIAL